MRISAIYYTIKGVKAKPEIGTIIAILPVLC